MQVAECPNAPKLDPRVRRTRKLLEDALRALLTERPYSDISVGDIAERATVNRATFYAHYQDKRDLTASLLREELHAALLASLPHRSPLDADSLNRVAAAVFEFLARAPSACPAHSDEFTAFVGPILQETIQEFFRTWLEYEPRGMRAFPGADREAVATVLGWSLYGAALRWSRAAPRRTRAEEAAREIVALLLR